MPLIPPCRASAAIVHCVYTFRLTRQRHLLCHRKCLLALQTVFVFVFLFLLVIVFIFIFIIAISMLLRLTAPQNVFAFTGI